MDWAYFCCVDHQKIDAHWKSTFQEIREFVIQYNAPEKAEHWALPDKRILHQAYRPQIEILASQFGGESIIRDTFISICSQIDVVKMGIGLMADRKKRSANISKKALLYKDKSLLLMDAFFRLFDLFKGVVLLNRNGPITDPMRVLIIQSYFPDYLRFFTKVKNHRRYDGGNRKNYIRAIEPMGYDRISEITRQSYRFNDLLDFPTLMDAQKWKEQWDVLNGMSGFWNDFKITKVKPGDPEASSELELTVDLAESKISREHKKRDPFELIQREFENRMPKIQKYDSPEYSRFASGQLRKIGEISSYAIDNNLSLVQYYI